jgi:hypothetical protein
VGGSPDDRRSRAEAPQTAPTLADEGTKPTSSEPPAEPFGDLPRPPSIEDLLPYLLKIDDRAGPATFRQIGMLALMGVTGGMETAVTLTTAQAGAILSAKSYIEAVMDEPTDGIGNQHDERLIKIALAGYIIKDDAFRRKVINWNIAKNAVGRGKTPPMKPDAQSRLIREEVARMRAALHLARNRGAIK